MERLRFVRRLLLAELLAQQVVDALKARLDRSAFAEGESTGIFNRHSRDSSPGPPSDKAAEEIIEVTPQHELANTHLQSTR